MVEVVPTLGMSLELFADSAGLSLEELRELVADGTIITVMVKGRRLVPIHELCRFAEWRRKERRQVRAIA